MKIKKKISGFFVICFFVSMIISCNSQKNIVNDFVRPENMPHILFISFPDIITKFFPSDFDLDSNLAFMPPKIHNMLSDSQIASFKSTYDSLFVNSSLRAGFKMFKADSIAQFFDKSNFGWQLNLLQITFEEHRFQYWDQVNYSNFSVIFDTIISSYEFNVWYELIPINNDSIKPIILFSTEIIQDELKGKFVFNRNLRNYEYQYEINEVNSDDILKLVVKSADNHTDYLLDYFLNKYLRSKNKINESQFLSFDRNRNKIVKSSGKRFYIVEN